MADKKKNVSKKKGPVKPAERKKASPYRLVGGLLFVVLMIFLIYTNLSKKNEKDKEFIFKKNGELTFLNQSSEVEAKIDIQIAQTDFDRELGLMYRKSMQENQGMLFVFPSETIQTFWMRNTFIPLDMVFINSNKQIVTIRNATKTLSDQTYASTAPAQYVLEVNEGFCKKFGIKVGDKISWKVTKKE